ncbi:MAG: co-chaperone GroES [Nitrospira sp.]|nr:co-chaperone GroES [Nitrospira sp.]
MSATTKEKKDIAKGFQPLGERVFVTYTEEMERTAGGIYVPDTAKEKPQRGIVQAIGKKVENVKVGDHVLFDKYSGTKLRIDDEECLILKEEDILGVFTNAS